MKTEVSIIIPLAPNDQMSEGLIQKLLLFPSNWEILICTRQAPEDSLFVHKNIRWIPTSGGRASSLNEGARQSKGEYLWFLHADSVLADGTYVKMQEVIERNETRLYYFDLKFIKMSSHNVKPKGIGVRFRSHMLNTPFGDQGFFMKRQLFEQFGPYSTAAAYGEDHLFVRKLRRNHIKITPIGFDLYTSPRKYEQGGWFRITMRYQYLWIKQALVDWWRHRGVRDNEYCNRGVL